MAHCFKAVPIDEATEIINQAPQFENWSRKDTLEVLEVIADNWLVKFTENPSNEPWYRWPTAIYEEAKLMLSLIHI